MTKLLLPAGRRLSEIRKSMLDHATTETITYSIFTVHSVTFHSLCNFAKLTLLYCAPPCLHAVSGTMDHDGQEKTEKPGNEDSRPAVMYEVGRSAGTC